MSIIVTGGAGFIGSNFIMEWLNRADEAIVNLDLLTYAGNLENLKSVDGHPHYSFVHADISDEILVKAIFDEFSPRAIINFAAESHVDRSIHGPYDFIFTNIIGTYSLLEVARNYFNNLNSEDKLHFRFLHVSTDEVYGSLNKDDHPFTELNRYEPNSPYSASKASSDHLVRAWHHTFGLPTLTTNCSNNYGPFQFPEKLIPLMIVNALSGKPLPIYGDGMQVRDWLYVKDHCTAIIEVLNRGKVGDTYNIGGWNEKPNIEIVKAICNKLDVLRPKSDGSSYANQITFVKDRPGHDRRYAIDAKKIERELGWRPSETFETGIEKTINWYLENSTWIEGIQDGSYRNWQSGNYGADLS